MSKSKYTTIASKIKQAFKTQDREALTEALMLMQNQFISYQAAIEVRNKKALPLDQRNIEVLDVESSTSKLTVNPCTGRVTLKVSSKCSPKVKSDLTSLTMFVSQQELPAVTMRGRIEFKDGLYQVKMLSESGKFEQLFKYKGEEEICVS